MTSKLKWCLLGLGFLGVNGLVIPVVSNSFLSSGFSLDSLFVGGGIPNLTNFSSTNELTSKAKLDLSRPSKQESSLDISNISLAPEVGFDLEAPSTPVSITEVLSSAEGEPNISDSISGIYSAIDIENKVKKVEQNMENKYSELVSKTLDKSEEKRKEYLNHFFSARNKLKGSKKERARRSVVPAPNLSQDHRSSLGKMYTLNNSLKNASAELALELRKVPGIDFPLAMPKIATNGSKNIEKSLTTIGWTEENIKTQRSRGRTDSFDTKSWGNWDENPFKPFYLSERDFENDIRSLQKNARAAFQEQQNLERTQSRMFDVHRKKSLLNTLRGQFSSLWDRIAALKASQDSHIVQKVADYLLKSMGQN